MSKQRAVGVIKEVAIQAISRENQARFIEAVEIELMSLHEGNIARYKLQAAEFTAWKERSE